MSEIILFLFFCIGLISFSMILLRAIHVVANDNNFIFFIAESYSILYISHLLYQSSVKGHIGCFYVLAVVNNAVIYIGVHIPLQISVFKFWG